MAGTKRLLSLGMTALRSNFATLGRPYKLNFAVTYWCNSRCLTCNIWQLKPKNELTLDEIKTFAKNNNYFKWVELTGGEPFMRSDTVEIVKAFAASMKNLYVLTMPTNSLINHDALVSKIESIAQIGIPRFVITLSLDGYRELHDKIRGVPGNFDKVMAVAASLHELEKKYRGFSFFFGYTMSKYNTGELAKTIESVKAALPWVDANRFHVNIAQVSGFYYNNASASFEVDANTASGELSYLLERKRPSFDAAQVVENAFLRKLLVFLKSGKRPMRTRNLELSVFLDSFGTVYPSIMWEEPLGNIRNAGYSLENLLNGEKAKQVLEKVKKGEEPNAWTSCDAYQALTSNLKELLL
ncbi:MAG: radical SAM/SPASM domain-containing protein [Candidatus Micrarchaeia archaeon]